MIYDEDHSMPAFADSVLQEAQIGNLLLAKGTYRLQASQAYLLMNYLSTLADIVRLVDAVSNTQFLPCQTGGIAEEPHRCYAVWGKETRCENCISAKALSTKGRVSKFEFLDGHIFLAIAKYVEIDGVPYVLEAVSKLTEDALFDADGKGKLAQLISGYNKKLYSDALTGAHNRQYYEEQVRELYGSYSVAMMDSDNFKQINDTYGHHAGDLALQAIIRAVFSCVRWSDLVIRYGGDEFLLLFQNIPHDGFAGKLEEIRSRVSSIVLKEYPALRLSVSIGGFSGCGKVTDLVCEADRALYQAKSTKSKTICVRAPVTAP